MRRFSFVVTAFLLLAPAMALAGPGVRQGIIDEIHTGVALVQSDGPNRVVVLFEPADRKAGGNIETLYSVKSKQPIDAPISLVLQDARMTVEERRVIVSSRRSKEVVVLDLGGGCPELQLNPSMKVYRFSGDELLRRGGMSLPPLMTLKQPEDVAFAQTVPEYVPWDDGTGAIACDSGGSGASSCSQTQGSSSCSITCASGYACCVCQLFQCKCSCKR